MPVRPFYDPTFDPGQAVAVTYWTTFVGTRSKLNQERMAARLRQADPKFYQEQVDAIQSNINELIQDKASAGRDSLQGFNRFLNSYTKAEGQRRKALIDLQSATIDAQARLAVERIRAGVDIATLSSEEKRAYAETASIQPETTNEMLTFLRTMEGLSEAAVRSQLDQKIAKYMRDNETSVGQNKGQLILAQFMDLAQQQQINNEAFNEVVGDAVGGRTSAQVRNQVGTLYVDQDNTRLEQILSRGGGVGSGGAGGAGGGTGGGAGGGDGDLEDDFLFKKMLELMTEQGADTQSNYDDLIAIQRQRLQRVEAQQQEAQDAVANFYTSSTGNPLLQPVFTRAAQRGRLGQQQEVIDASAGNLQRDPTGLDFEARSKAISQADGDITSIDPMDVDPYGSTDTIRDDESGEFLFSHIYRQLSLMRSDFASNPAETERRLLELHRLAMKVPRDVRDRYPDVFAQLDLAVQAVANPSYNIVEQNDGTFLDVATNQPYPTRSEAFNAARNRSKQDALRRAVSSGSALEEALVAAHNQGDIHNAAIIADAIGLANNDDDVDSATDRISEIAEYAEASGELGGELNRVLSRLYNKAVDAGDGALLRQNMSNIGRTADRSMYSRTDDDGRVIPPDIGVNAKEAFVQSGLDRDERSPTLEEDLTENVPIDPIEDVATNLMSAPRIRLANLGLSEVDVQRALKRNQIMAGSGRYSVQDFERRAQEAAGKQPFAQQEAVWQQPPSAARARRADELGSVSTQQEDVMTTLGFDEALMPIVGDFEYQTDLSNQRLALIEQELMAENKTLSGEEATRLAQLQIGQELLEEQKEVAQRYRSQAQQAKQRLQQMKDRGPPEIIDLDGFVDDYTQGGAQESTVWPPRLPDIGLVETELRAYGAQLIALQNIVEKSPKYADSIEQAAAETQQQMQEYQPAEDLFDEAAEPEEEPGPQTPATTSSRSRSTAPTTTPTPASAPVSPVSPAQPTTPTSSGTATTSTTSPSPPAAPSQPPPRYPAPALLRRAQHAQRAGELGAFTRDLSPEERKRLSRIARTPFLLRQARAARRAGEFDSWNATLTEEQQRRVVQLAEEDQQRRSQ
tara:strand:- start:3180 stop:6428 length:3249 start_codon:yes stop_codon:yes gene_type:complete